MAEDNTPTNVVDDLAKQNELINNFVNSMKTEGNLEFYVKHSGTEVPASSIRYNPRIGIGSQIPGFYTEPLGIRDIKAMGGRGGPNAISNYYKVQVNSNNLLISAGGGKVTGLKSPISSVGYADLGNEIEKIDWKIFEQETGLSWENDFNGKRLFSVENGQKYLGSDSQGFIKRLGVMGLTDDEISSALRKSGIEGFVSGPTNNQYEVVLLDPNDDLGVGKNINVQDATETDFVNNQSKVNQIDELIIDTPTNVVDDINRIGTLDYPNQWHNTPTVKLVEAIAENNLDIYIKKTNGEFVKLGLDDAARIGENAIQNSPMFDKGKLAVYNAIEKLGDVDNPRYKLDLYSSNPDELAKLKNALSNVNLDPFVNPEGTPFQLTTDTPTNVVGDEFVDNIVNANTQLVNDLPLSETVKNQFDNVVRNRAKNLATPGGVIDAVDVWEMGVLGLMITAIAYKEFDEIPTIFKRTATNMFNSMTSMYNIPPVPLEQYDLDYEFIEKVITTGEKVMPTDIIIKKVQEKAEEFEGESTASGYAYMTPSAKNTDTMETTQKIQPGVQEEKMFEQLRPKKTKSAGGSGARIQ